MKVIAYSFIKSLHSFLFFLIVAISIAPTIMAQNCSYNPAGPQCGVPTCEGYQCTINPPPRQNLPEAGRCLKCLGYDEASQRYRYQHQYSDVIIDTETESCTFPQRQGSTVTFPLPQNTNVDGCWMSGAPPTGCNQGFECAGGGGGACGNGSPIGGCPVQYRGDNCSRIPCGYRIVCECSCGCDGECELDEGQCVEVPGGAPPSPTPTPSPYCTLSCFGISGRTGGSDLGGSQNPLGGGSGSEPAPTVLPPLITGTINYSGYHGFACGTFKDGMWYSGSCPVGQGGGGVGQSSSWSQNAKYNMLCGGSPFTYTAEVDATTGGGGAGGQLSPTPPPGSPTPARYPQGCQVGVTPTPTLPGGGVGTQGGTTSTNSCSCSVTLSCQSTLSSSPNSTGQGCTPTCNFAVNPEYPLFNSAAAFYIIDNTPSNNITFSFDDGSGNVTNQTSVNHTFVNAGVYDVSLSCTDTSETCTRRVNSYCNNGVVPSPTPTPSPTPGPWFKVKDADFIQNGAINNVLPSSVTAYDTDDTGSPDCSGQVGGANIRCLNLNQPGLVIAKNTIDIGSAPVSNRAWKLENYTIKRQIDASSYVDYVSSRKKPKKITSDDLIIDATEIQSGYVNVITGNYTINNTNVTSQAPYVLVVKGDLTIDVTGTFGTSGNGAAYVVTGTLNITAQTTELNGIFIANALDVASDIATGSTTTNPLKIRGNISVTNATNTLGKRARTDNSKSSILSELDFTPFKELLPLLSVRSYEWEELTP